MMVDGGHLQRPSDEQQSYFGDQLYSNRATNSNAFLPLMNDFEEKDNGNTFANKEHKASGLKDRQRDDQHGDCELDGYGDGDAHGESLLANNYQHTYASVFTPDKRARHF